MLGDEYSALELRIKAARTYPRLPVTLLFDALNKLNKYVPKAKKHKLCNKIAVLGNAQELRLIGGNGDKFIAVVIKVKMPYIRLCNLSFRQCKELLELIVEQHANATVAISRHEECLVLKFNFDAIYQFYGADYDKEFNEMQCTKEIVMPWQSEIPDWKLAEIKRQELNIRVLVEEIALMSPTTFSRMAHKSNVQTSRNAWIGWIKQGNVHEHISVSWEEFLKTQQPNNTMLENLEALGNALDALVEAVKQH